MATFAATVLALLGLTPTPASASIGTGGTITYTDSSGLNPRSSPAYPGGYVVHTFTSTGTFTPPSAGCTADVLVVGGGGGGGAGSGGGGGSGGVIYQSGFAVSSGPVAVTVGGGGTGGSTTAAPTNGTNSVFSTFTAKGGGLGSNGPKYPIASPDITAGNGGSGGGGCWAYGTAGTGTAGQGNNGGAMTAGSYYAGAGGGGAGVAGSANVPSSANGGAGGAGLQYSISGNAQYYGGGGGGGADNSRVSGASGGTGGSGGGGSGGAAATPTAGTANTGGGGGGAGNAGSYQTAMAGGSGIVIVRYPYVNGPVIMNLNPVKNSTGVAVNPNLVVTFDQNVQKGTGNMVIKQTSDDSVLQTIDVTSGQVTVSGTMATIIPSSNLPYGTPCYVQMDAGTFTATADSSPFAGITDKTTWTFKTAGGAPLVSILNPANTATGVPDTANLVVTFDQPVQKGSGNIMVIRTSDNNVLQMIDVTSVPVTVSGAVATIPLTGNLPLGTPCYVQIPAGAFSSAADSTPFVGITDTTTWTFTTMGAPLVSTLNPANNATGVSVGSSLVVTFNQNVQKGTGNIVILKTSDNSVVQTIDVTSGQVTVSGAVATIIPSGYLPASTQCYVQIAAGAFTATIGSMPPFAGITDTTTWSFTTGTYNFTFTPTAANTYAWTNAGNWTNGVPASATSTTVKFFSDTTTALASGTIAVNSDPATLTLNTLTLNGKGGATANAVVNIGTAGNTWTFDGTTPTINLSGMDGTKPLQVTVNPNITLNQNLIVTGNGTASGGFSFTGNITGNYSLTKSGTSALILGGAGSNYSGGTVINAGTLTIGADANLGAATGGITFTGNATLYSSVQSLAIGATRTITVNPGVTATFKRRYANETGTITINGPVTGGGGVAASADYSLGSGVYVLANTGNNFTGPLTIPAGAQGTMTIQVASLTDGAGYGNIQFGTSGTITYTGSGQTLNNRRVELVNNNVAANVGGPLTINTDLLVDATAGTNTLTLSGSGGTFNGKIANGSGTAVTALAVGGTWTLTAQNTYTGSTSLQGTVNVNSIKDFGVASNFGAASSGVIPFGMYGGATVNYTGGGDTANRTFSFQTYSVGSAAGAFNNNGAGPLIFSASTFNTLTTGNGKAYPLTLGGTYTGSANQIQGVVQNAATSPSVDPLTLTKAGAGTWLLSGANTYTGATTIQAGSLVAGTDSLASTNGAFGNAGSAIVLGNGSTAASDAPALLINGAYTVGRAITVDSVANTTAYNATIGGSNTTGTATYTGNITLGTNTQYTTTLQAATGGTVEFKTGTWTTNNKAIAIGSSGNTGTVKLSNSIATSGGIKVNYGTLALGAGNVLAATTPVSIGSATLDAATFTDTLGTLNATGSAIINLGAGAALAFADSHLISWAGTLNLTGTFVSGSSLRFGTNNSGLTSTQLAKITATGFSNFALDSNGFLTATTGSSYATWASNNGATGQTLNQDHDGDGVPNGIEYFLGGPNGNTTGFTALPGVTNTNGTLSVTWNKGTGYTGIYGTDYVVETSATLNGDWATEPGSGGQVTDNPGSVTYTFPSLGNKKFARLKVTGP